MVFFVEAPLSSAVTTGGDTAVGLFPTHVGRWALRPSGSLVGGVCQVSPAGSEPGGQHEALWCER